MAEMARRFAGKENQMRNELRETVKQFLEQFTNPEIKDVSISEDVNVKLFNLACFIAEARSGVSRDRYTQAIEYLPEAEGPARLVKQLFTLGCGIAIVQGGNELNEGVYEVLKKIGRDTLPSHRNLILRKMWETEMFGNSWEKTRTLAGHFNYPVQTTKLQLEDLMILRLMDRKIEGSSEEHEDGGFRRSDATNPYYWRLSERCVDLIKTSGVYDVEDDSWDFSTNEVELNKQSPGVAI